MTSSSSLYGTVTQQNTSSSNSTSLYGGAATPIPDSSGNVVVRGDLYVLSGNILTTATTGNIFPANATTINLGLAATTVNIGAGSGTTTINNALVADSADFGNITIAVADDQTITTTTGELRLGSTSGDIKLTGIDTLYTDTTGTFNLLNAPTTVFAFRNATTLSIGEDTGTTTVNNNLTVDGDTITVAQGTTIAFSEANSRFNRPNFQSTSGNTSGVRAIGPNTSSSSRGVISAFSSSDLDNGSFINIQATNGGTDPLRIQTGTYTGGTIGPSGTSLAFVDSGTTYATVNPSGTTVNSDLATKLYVDNAIATTPGSELVNGAFTFKLESDGSVTSEGNYNLAQATSFLYDENNDRTNRPSVQSTSGNSSGFRVLAPNATTSASAVLSTFNTDDIDNGKFINIQARGNATTPLRITTGEYTAGVLGASNDSIVFVDGGGAAHASINPAGPSATTDLVTVGYLTAGSFVFSQVNIDNRVYLDSNQLVTSATTPLQTLDSFAVATYRSAKYQVSVSSGSDVQVMEVLVMHNGTTAYQTVYADMFSNASLTDIAVTISGGNVLLQVTPVNAVTTYKISRTLIVV